jgi:hypothetical protein
MSPDDRKGLVALITDALAYYRQPVSEFTLQVWVNACDAYSLEQVRKAITAHATDPERGQFAPKVADVVRHLSGTLTDRSQMAWGKALDAASSVGAYSDVVFDDPAIHAAIEDMGGWPKFCRSETKELSYLQHRFCESYRAYVGRGDFSYPARLGGDRSSDAMYAKRGLPPPKPAVVGDKDRARLVYQNGGAAKAKVAFHSLADLSSAIPLLNHKEAA